MTKTWGYRLVELTEPGPCDVSYCTPKPAVVLAVYSNGREQRLCQYHRPHEGAEYRSDGPVPATPVGGAA